MPTRVLTGGWAKRTDRVRVNEAMEFSYRVRKGSQVAIFQNGSAAAGFLTDVENADEKPQQSWMAHVTGNFECGNERPARPHDAETPGAAG